MSPGHSDDAFDRNMRALHHDAVAQVSPEVRRRLRAARDPARARRSAPRFGWPAASAIAAATVLAIALPLRSPPPDGSRTATTPPHEGAVATRTTSRPPATDPASGGAEAAVPTALAALEESPDFYLWLASNDARPDGALP